MADGQVPPTGEPLTGAIELPDGSWVRGRGVRHGPPVGVEPDFGLYLGVDYQPPWEHQAIAWPDFWLPRHPQEAARLLRQTHERARAGDRVEVACGGGHGRTGTAIACLAILAGVQPDEAVRWVRRHYDDHAVETPWQRRWVRRFPRLLSDGLHSRP